jgi:uncharacterized membrane protein
MKIVLSIAMVVIVMSVAGSSRADITACNNYTTSISVSFDMVNCAVDGCGGDTGHYGWWNIAPGNCATMMTGNLNPWAGCDVYYLYFYAQATNGATWSDNSSNGSNECVESSAFTTCYWHGDPGITGHEIPCTGSGERTLNYYKEDIGSYSNWTETFD